MFANPALQSFYTNLEALVYDEAAKEIEDLTLPDCTVQDPKVEQFLDEIEEEFGTVRIVYFNLFFYIYCFVLICRRKPLLEAVENEQMMASLVEAGQRPQKKICH